MHKVNKICFIKFPENTFLVKFLFEKFELVNNNNNYILKYPLGHRRFKIMSLFGQFRVRTSL